MIGFQFDSVDPKKACHALRQISTCPPLRRNFPHETKSIKTITSGI